MTTLVHFQALAASAPRALVRIVLALGLVVAPPLHGWTGDGAALAEVGPDCGNESVDDGEACDEGSANSDDNGAWCGLDCTVTPCGSPVTRVEGDPSATDALYALRSAVALVTCDERVCDVNDDGNVSASDALRILRLAVGTDVTLTCPAPTPDITCVNKTFTTITEVFEALAGDYEIFLDDGSGSIDDVYTSG